MSAEGQPILRVDNVRKAFGGLHAVDGCTLEVREGTITALIGPNGAGKSTLFNIVTGLYAPDAGQIWFYRKPRPTDLQRGLRHAARKVWQSAGPRVKRIVRILGDEKMWPRLDAIIHRLIDPSVTGWSRIDGLPPHLVVREGLVKTWQVPREFKNLPVLDNVILAAVDHPGERFRNLILHPLASWRRELHLEQEARKILTTVGLQRLAETPAKNLSGGQKKLLELARALMTNPALILLDEPMAGVNPVLAGQLMDLIDALRSAGHTFFLVEHDMETVMSRCDWIIVMHEGRKIAEGVPKTVKADPLVLESYLGG